MKYITCMFLFLSINCYSQELKKFEHWNDRYNSENKIEIKKTKEFLAENNINLFEIYNAPKGVKNRFLDGLPYIIYTSIDTITYLIPGGLFPTSRENFKNNLNDNNTRAFFVNGIRKDGRIGVNSLHEFRFLRQGQKFYHLYITYNLKKEDENKLMDRLFEANTEDEYNKIKKELDRHMYYKRELIFDFEKQIKAGDIIRSEPNRFSQLLEITKTNNRKYYKVKTNITSLELREMVFTFNSNGEFYLIEGHEIRK
ncbi:hypothetical protein L3073_05290 [Ancylomarina sp. DW003]|nr:hypothetical protein [Ancylomarina sp. DW003]MDE5421611.1 hypothetical protein [Ancylomarina sp. DW003]